MITCLCKAMRDGDVRRALHAGVTTVSGVYRHYGHTPQCGKCVPYVLRILREHQRVHHHNPAALVDAAD